MTGDFDKTVLERVAHRPWPMPDGPWVMTQTWHDLLFAHWPIGAGALRPLVPPALELDTFDGRAWIAVVPFSMTNVAPRFLPAVPPVSEFPELNVRTYVRVGARPGVYFFSLDAGSWLAVRAARLILNLPYHSATMTVTSGPSGLVYRSRRKAAKQRATFSAEYRARGPSFIPAPGSLEHFLTERYCLYHTDRRGRPYRLDIHHPRWQLQPADARIDDNTMAEAAGLSLPPERPLLHFSKRQDMVAWPPARGRALE